MQKPAIDINSEQLLTLAQAAECLPSRNGSSVHPTTVWRWMHHGIGGIKLPSIVIGRVRYTSREALQRWANELTARETVQHA